MVPLLPMMDVWTNFEDGRSRRSGVIDRKQKGYRRTDRQTSAKQNALFFSKGDIIITMTNNCMPTVGSNLSHDY